MVVCMYFHFCFKPGFFSRLLVSIVLERKEKQPAFRILTLYPHNFRVCLKMVVNVWLKLQVSSLLPESQPLLQLFMNNWTDRNERVKHTFNLNRHPLCPYSWWFFHSKQSLESHLGCSWLGMSWGIGGKGCQMFHMIHLIRWWWSHGCCCCC